MKTNQIMIRELSLGDLKVFQRSEDGMFNATTLVKQWNDYSGQDKKLQKFFERANTIEFLAALTEDMVLTDWKTSVEEGRPSSGQLEIFDPNNISKDILRVTRGKNAGTWMHPFLFTKLAIWLDVKLEIQMIRFVHDQLISYRHGAGDNYKVLSGAISKFEDVEYKKVARGLNFIIFGEHKSGLRQTATEKQLHELIQLEKNLTFAVSNDLITSFDQLLGEMRKIYKYKYPERY